MVRNIIVKTKIVLNRLGQYVFKIMLIYKFGPLMIITINNLPNY